MHPAPSEAFMIKRVRFNILKARKIVMNIHYRWRHLRSTYGTRLDFLPTDLYPRQHGGGNRGAYKIFWGGGEEKNGFRQAWTSFSQILYPRLGGGLKIVKEGALHPPLKKSKPKREKMKKKENLINKPPPPLPFNFHCNVSSTWNDFELRLGVGAGHPPPVFATEMVWRVHWKRFEEALFFIAKKILKNIEKLYLGK